MNAPKKCYAHRIPQRGLIKRVADMNLTRSLFAISQSGLRRQCPTPLWRADPYVKPHHPGNLEGTELHKLELPKKERGKARGKRRSVKHRQRERER
jgi:hypothetical protein